MHRCFLGLLLALALGCVSAGVTPRTSDSVGTEAHDSGSAISAESALARLADGNQRFATAALSAPKPNAARRAATATTQHPFAIVVGCSDSRTAPELVFDQNLGDLFTVRVAGNLVDAYALGSIEYAVEHLGARLIVVLGHERCGAVKAALASADAEGHVGNLVRDLQPAVAMAKGRSGDPLEAAVEANAALVAEKIRREAHFGDRAPEVRVVAGYYDLDTGIVRWQDR